MSISPQSLASTREKRSSRIPARFDDCEIPPEVTYRNVAEALKLKTKAHKRPNQDPAELVRRKEGGAGSASSKKAKSQKSRTGNSSSSSSDKLKDLSPTSSLTPSSTPAQTPTPPISTPPPLSSAAVAAAASSTLLTTVAPIAEQLLPKHPVSAPSRNAVVDIELECKETPPNESAYLKIDVDPFVSKRESKVSNTTSSRTTSMQDFVKRVYYDESTEDTVENLELDVQALTRASATSGTIKKVDDNVIKKSPFHPSITITSNGIRLSGSNNSKPLLEKKMAHMPPIASGQDQTNTATPISVPKQGSRSKKSKGFSLMVKTPSSTINNGAFQGSNNLSRTPTTPTAQQPPQQAKFYNNLAQNMQYGTRLMLNEPVYLPRSVASIAPITATLQQIVNQSRRPPFVSKKAEAYLTYQEERKFNLLASNYTILLKITEYLAIPEILTLRGVSKTWKSIIDSDVVWKRVKVNSETPISQWERFTKIICRYQTSELIIDNYIPPAFDLSYPMNICKSFSLLGEDINLRQICISSKDMFACRFVLELLVFWNSIVSCPRKIEILWKVKVRVEADGRALVLFKSRDYEDYKGLDKATKELLYVYDQYDEMLGGYPEQDILVESWELEELFNGNPNDKSKLSPENKPHVIVEPI